MSDICTARGCCDSLLSRLSDGKGFKDLHTMNLSQKVGQAEERFLGVCYKTSAKDKGLMLNWCPFCGGAPGYFERKRVPAFAQADQPKEPT